MEDIEVLIGYISVWNWFVLSWISLIAGFIFLAFDTFIGNILFFAMIVCFLICIFLSYLRRIKFIPKLELEIEETKKIKKEVERKKEDDE